MLELLVLVFHRAFHPVLAIEIHHDAALVKAMMALCEVGLYNKTKELLTGLHLQDGCVVVLEVIVGALPKVGVRSCGDNNRIAFYFESSWLTRPFERIEVNLATVSKSSLHIVGEIHNCFLLFFVCTSCQHQAAGNNDNEFFEHCFKFLCFYTNSLPI